LRWLDGTSVLTNAGTHLPLQFAPTSPIYVRRNPDFSRKAIVSQAARRLIDVILL
jgi:hypothetical protein